MKTEISAGYITLILEDEDFQRIDWRKFLEELKEKIAFCDRDYDGTLKLWSIIDAPYNRQVIKELYDKFFKVKEQGELF